MKKLITTILILLVLIGGYYVFKRFPEKTLPPATNGTTTEALNIPSDWKTYTDNTNNLVFSYPETLNTKYVQFVDWPPKVEVATSSYACVQAGNEIQRAGETKEISVSGNKYCVTKLVEGAAGTMYTQYAYEAKVQNKVLYYTFTLRQPQCGNYNDPQKTECQNEEDAFDINPIINTVIQSTKFK